MATLEEIIEAAKKLSLEERRRLLSAIKKLEPNGDVQQFNQEFLVPRRQASHTAVDDEVRRQRLEWLKSHREEYGGQYVALDGDQLLAVGPNYRVAKEKALAAGKPNAFVTYLSKADEIAEMGGWA